MRITDGQRTEEARELYQGEHDFGPAEHGDRECSVCLIGEGPATPQGYFWQRIKPASWALRDVDGHVYRWIDFAPG